MSKERSKITSFVKSITELFKQNKYKEINDQFDRGNLPELNSFYSLSARLKYIHSIALRKETKFYNKWFQESSICFSPNYLPYIPSDYFEEWIGTFYAVGKEECEQWLPPGESLTPINNENTFLKVNASFSKKIVLEGDPAEINVSLISTLPKEIRNASIAVIYSINTTSENGNNSFIGNSKKPEMAMIAENQTIIPNKRLSFKSSVLLVDQLYNTTDVTLTDVIIIINTVKLIFSVLTNNSLGDPTRSKELRIEPKDIGCSLVANLPPPGFVDVPAPIHLKFSTSDLAGYSIILSVSCKEEDKKDTFISLNPDMSGEMKNIKIDVEKPFKEYSLTFYAFSHIPKEINLQLNWHDRRDGRDGKTMIQELPLEFQFPFILKSRIFNESSSCRTEVNISKTPLLTKSSYSIFTEFTSNCPWPITIQSFEIVPERETQDDDFYYLKRRLSDVNSDIPEPDNNNKKESPIIFQKPIINLPIMLEHKDRFSAFTKFSTGDKVCNSINLGSLLIRYFMHSTIYKGTHLFIFKLPGIGNMYVNKRNQLSQFQMSDSNLLCRKNSQNDSNKKFGFKNNQPKTNKNIQTRNSCLISNTKILNNNNINNMVSQNTQTTISIEKLKLNVEFDFPSRGSQFEMCELTLKMTNVSETPLEIVLDIKPSEKFLMAGTLSTQIGLFPFDPAEISLKFFPLAHGSLTFPEITINSAQVWAHCYWSAKPTIFISYPVAS